MFKAKTSLQIASEKNQKRLNKFGAKSCSERNKSKQDDTKTSFTALQIQTAVFEFNTLIAVP